MANVKISELPNLANKSLKNIIIVNDITSDVTSKSELTNALQISSSIPFTPNSEYISMTVNNAASDTINISHTFTPLGFGLLSNVDYVVFNNTSNDFYAPVSIKTTAKIYAYYSPLIPVQIVNMSSLKASNGNSLSYPFYIKCDVTNSNVSVITLKGVNTSTNTLVNACIPPNSSWHAAYLEWYGVFKHTNSATW